MRRDPEQLARPHASGNMLRKHDSPSTIGVRLEGCGQGRGNEAEDQRHHDDLASRLHRAPFPFRNLAARAAIAIAQRRLDFCRCRLCLLLRKR
jgi:hypothetical protein